ncbi:hypothetical protein ED733_008720 [Metarhizium rileyi]|uniref:Fungal-type protein kinase domain-containing protein n=1 Tax=Metarhizium rileyi (strain RCEF 4871) TaxID=1649241 RepID=A0A5C6GMB7_METRR|nr:hypothetical protein ED733_008720 [Metarhizium rileyi]
MALSKEQIKIIADHPLNDLLARLPDTLHALTESYGSWRADVAALLGILVDSTAAYNLLLSDGSGNVADKLFPVRQKVRLGGSLNFSHFRTLLDTIINKSPDTDVWSAVIALIDAVNPPTPPPSSIVRTACGTPVKTSSSRLADSETRDIIERELFYEIRDCTHRSVPGFFEKHFDSTKWTKKQKNMLRSILANHDGARWENFPANPLEAHVWDWLADLEAKALTGAAYSLHTNKSANEFKNRKGQMDIFFQKPSRSKSGRFYYKHVLIVGEHTRSLGNTADFKACLLQLTRHVRSIFDDQPMRRFVHAFTIKATTMELWIFDRSGAYSSGEFDIHRDPEKFARALVAYATMDDESMGLDKSIDWESGSRYITIQNANGKSERVNEIMTIADLRAGLDFSDKTRHNFRTTIHDRSDGYNRLQDTDTSGSSRKRKSLDEDTRPPARRRPNSQGSALGTACGFKGMLIDLDLAKERDSKPSGARNQTGTMQFMAIQVLRGADHTYRHDLESFFHVLLWLCAMCAWDEKKKLYDEDEAQPAVSILRKWEIGNFVDIADAKEGHMTVNGVERIMDEFPNACYAAKSLCLKIRSLLFGDTARIMIGTPAGDPQRLYEAILTSFDEAIEQI